VPSGRRATMSVNVPPRSIQNCQVSGIGYQGSRIRPVGGRCGIIEAAFAALAIPDP
jgi:hypothetical protein